MKDLRNQLEPQMHDIDLIREAMRAEVADEVEASHFKIE